MMIMKKYQVSSVNKLLVNGREWNRATLTLAFITFSAIAHAQQDCYEVIRLSQTEERSLVHQSRFEELRSNFCEDYQQSQSQGRSTNISGSFKAFGAAFGSNSTDVQSLASTYCREDKRSGSQEDRYEGYVRDVASGAWDAYSQCLASAQDGVKFSDFVLRRDVLQLRIRYESSNSDSFARLKWTGSQPVYCQWDVRDSDVGDDESRVSLGNMVSTTLRCSRKSFNAQPKAEPDFVQIIRENGNRGALSVDWTKYDSNGMPIATLEEIRADVDRELRTFREELGAFGRSAVVAFNAERCPDGWTEFEEAYGRFVRGIDRSGEQIDPDSKTPREPGHLQSDSYGEHVHKYEDAYWSERKRRDNRWINGTLAGNKGESDSDNLAWTRKLDTEESGAGETRPKNVALLYCIKG